jgi:AraC-like DNA-binding protein
MPPGLGMSLVLTSFTWSCMDKPMKLSQLTRSQLERVNKLLEEKESLEAQLAAINDELDSIGGDQGAAIQPKARAIKVGKAKRGQIKEQVIEILKSSGPSGITLKELSQQLGVNSRRLSIWFTTTGKKVKEIQRLGRGQYGWVESKATAETKAAIIKPKRKMNDAQRAKIGAGAKKRWAKFRAAKKAAADAKASGKGKGKGKDSVPF